MSGRRADLAWRSCPRPCAGLIQSLTGGGGEGGGAPNLGPIISAILGDKEAAASLPAILGLVGQLGLQLPGSSSS